MAHKSGRQSTSSSGGYHPVIEICDGFKHYGIRDSWKLILQKLTLKAYPNQIYVLLGARGCGKSTVIDIILGITKLSQGSITVFGANPKDKLSGLALGRVGYAPEHAGVYENFTVAETFRYYGSLLGLSSSYVTQRTVFLTDLLKLPTEKLLIKNFPANIVKLISFAIAILHQPDLMVFDEPMDGIDPAVRESLWSFMHDSVNLEDKSIFLTTTNSVDGQEADMLGIMKNGHLLAENVPNNLLALYNMTRIDKLYIRVYKIEADKHGYDPSESLAKNSSKIRETDLHAARSEGFLYVPSEKDRQVVRQKKSKLFPAAAAICSFLKEFWPSWRRLKVLIWRCCMTCYRSYLWMLLLIILPFSMILLFGYTIGLDPHSLEIGVVNKELEKKNTCPKDLLSCQFLSKINKKLIILKEFNSDEEALDAVHSLKIYGYLSIAKDFSQLLLAEQNIKQNLATLHVEDVTSLIADFLKACIQDTFHDFLHQKLGRTYPLKIHERTVDGSSTICSEFILPGLAVLVTYHMAAYLASTTLVADKVNKVRQRDCLYGATSLETFLSLELTYGTIVFLEACLVFLVLIYVFGVPMHGQIYCLLPYIFIQIWCGLRFGMLLAEVCTATVSATCLVMLSFLLSLMLENIIWPQEGMPYWLEVTVNLLPHTKTAEGVRWVMFRGTSLKLLLEWLGIIIPFCWDLIFAIAIIVLSRI